jgi:hypothetical protein
VRQFDKCKTSLNAIEIIHDDVNCWKYGIIDKEQVVSKVVMSIML